MKQSVLFTSKQGIEFIRTDYVKRSKVVVRDKENHRNIIRIYRFDNVPEYKHQYISWENLNCCEGWLYDKEYMVNEAVQNDKKILVSWFCGGLTIEELDEWLNKINTENLNLVISDEPADEHAYRCNFYRGVIATKGNHSLSYYYDVEEILEHYKKLGIMFINDKKLKELFEIPVLDLYCDKELEEKVGYTLNLVLIGLILGYPLESTASILMGY